MSPTEEEKQVYLEVNEEKEENNEVGEDGNEAGEDGNEASTDGYTESQSERSETDKILDFLMAGDFSLQVAAGELYNLFSDPNQASRLARMVRQCDVDLLVGCVSRVMQQECTALHLFAIGGNNVLYLALLKDGSDVLLRYMPDIQQERFREVGQLNEDVASHECELAMYEWVRTHTTIPIPKIYGSGFAPGPYIVMERAKGIPPWHVLPRSSELVTKFVEQLIDFERQLRNAPFPAIGSLRAPDVVGPIIFERLVFTPPVNRGPFESSKAYALAYIDDQKALLSDDAEWKRCRVALGVDPDTLPKPYALTFFDLLKSGLDELPDTPELFRLVYYDMRPPNVLLRDTDDATITAVFDWQGARVMPTWERGGFHPDALQYFDLPPDDEELDRVLEAQYSESIPAYQGFPWRDLIYFLARSPVYWNNKEKFDAFVRGWKVPDEHAAGFLPLQTFVGLA